MRTEVIRITPEMALDMLCKNSANRKIRQSRVKYYAEQMRAGNWHLTGQGITFAKDGTLLDGQHRLHAIVECEIPQEMLVIYDADKVSTYDCGLKRSIADQLQLAGANFANSVMNGNGLAMIKLYMCIEKCGTITHALRDFSADDIMSWVADHEADAEYFTGLLYSKSGRKSLTGTRRAVIYATIWAVYNLNIGFTKEDVVRVVNLLQDGLATDDGDAAIIGFRNQIIAKPRMLDIEVFYRMQYAIYRYLKKANTLVNKYESRMKYDFTKLKKEEK